MASKLVENLAEKRDELRKGVATVGDMRPGSLVERYRRCGKPGCHCAKEGARGHGPSWSLTRAVGGKTVTTIIPANAVDQTRHDIAEYQRFRKLTRDLVDVSERVCDARLDAAKTVSDEAVTKGGSKRPSRRKSSRRSTRS
jgi:hypothetical protein